VIRVTAKQTDTSFGVTVSTLQTGQWHDVLQLEDQQDCQHHGTLPKLYLFVLVL
jgi:hypothetical protein